jgi:hypothetical protein
VKAYHLAWRVVAGILAGVGISAAVLLSPAVLVFLVGVAVVGTILMLLAVRGDGGRSRRDSTGRLLTSGLAAGTVAGALVGFTALLGAGTFPAALCFLGSSPYAVKAWSRWRRSRLTPSTAQAVAMDAALAHMRSMPRPSQACLEPSRLTDEQLCQAWRASFRALGDGSSGIQMMGAVAARQRLLDEFERRNSRGLTAWLASGARAAGNPLPYLAESRVNSPAIDWDELTRGQDC